MRRVRRAAAGAVAVVSPGYLLLKPLPCCGHAAGQASVEQREKEATATLLDLWQAVPPAGPNLLLPCMLHRVGSAVVAEGHGSP
jgi:hypothetical protein